MHPLADATEGRSQGAHIFPPLFSCRPLQLQSSVTEFEFSQEEYRQLQVEFWSKFYACCLQYQEALSMPLGLTVSQHTGMACLLKKVTVPLLPPAAQGGECGVTANTL